MRAALAGLRDRPIARTDKGFGRIAADPAGPGGSVTSASLAARRPYLLGGEFMLPVLVLREAALEQNIAAMAGYCASAGVGLAPHGKTTMAPQIIARQLAAGAWGMTAATIAQVQVYRAFGVPRVLIANELTDPGGIGWLAAELAADPDFDCYAYVDSAAGVALLDGLLRAKPASGGRCRCWWNSASRAAGPACRSTDEALAVARAAASAGTLRLAGAKPASRGTSARVTPPPRWRPSRGSAGSCGRWATCCPPTRPASRTSCRPAAAGTSTSWRRS